ncbi:uncharacterized protein LOC112088427 [Eutrema salsugineum]|uniref:uncharacterized protein LOC112088427 n=1 Tax=Eutrema salsugineum TaxID=72664 RepID=UPI000CED234A|nr:uncharacterized protein LOC112088427 [Eutrema salsugineum]
MNDGSTVSFWFDNWTEFGPLISFLGESGPSSLRLHNEARVCDAIQDGFWNFRAARSDRAEEVLIYVASRAILHPSAGCGRYLWRTPSGNFSSSFSSKGTWDQLRSVPRFSFHLWLSFQKRLPSRDRLHRWGLQCSFSSSIWVSLASRLGHNPPLGLLAISQWIPLLSMQPTRSSQAVAKLLLQVTAHHLWRERNARIFNMTSSSSDIKARIDRTMRDRLLSFPARGSIATPSLLEFYFGCFC